MSALATIQKDAKTQAEFITNSAGKTIENMGATFQTLFRFQSLSDAAAHFSAGDVTVPNDSLAIALAASQEALDSTVVSCLTIERYILLTIPKMEDGNNFGVTVQLAALKMMKDDREKLEKIMEELSKYASTRADAMEKCKLPSSTKTKSTAQSLSNTETKGGEKEGTTSNTTSAEEDKTVESINQIAEAHFRQQAVWAVDTLFYSKARNAFLSALTCFMTAVDFMDKNKEKIAAPKGASGGTGYSNMY